jgi:uncharacterized membrane protein (UPF0182 family)
VEKKKRRFGLKAVLVILVLLALLIFSMVGYITDFLWFKELGYVSVFFKKLVTQLEIGIPTFVVVTVLTFIYLKVLKRGYYKKIETNSPDGHRTLNGVTGVLSLVMGVIVTYMAVNSLWFRALQYFNSTDFGIQDPLFSQDISFYTFKLDFITQVNSMLIGVLVAFLAITLVYYIILISTRAPRVFEPGQEPPEEETYSDNAGAGQGPFRNTDAFGPFGQIFGQMGKSFGGGTRRRKPGKQLDNENLRELMSIASVQLIIVGVIFFLMLAVNFYLKQYSLLFGSTGAVYGAGFTDVNITLWMYRILMGLALLGVVVFAVGIARKKFKLILTIPVVMIFVGLMGGVTGMLVQNFIVSPDEINKESKYLERNIEYTQYAYNLDDVDIRPFAASNDLTAEDIKNNEATISNIRINDYEPAEKFYNQTQSIRQYYSFNDVDVDRYMVNGDYTQTFLSAREIDETKISTTWLNTHLKYTHGYGVTLSRVDKITASGQPDMLIDSIPPISKVPEIAITRPEIYFGELTNNYIIINTDEDEFDYPQGDTNAYARYEGSAGIKMNLFNKALFAIRERSLKLLVSSNIDGDSRIIINRNIEKRIQKIMPYLTYDSDPYMVIGDGKLYWIIDAYTTSSKYPYSQPYNASTRMNYVRNSVKVVVDAYNGNVDYYIVDKEDPIAATFQKIYPKLFKDMEDMPESLKAHLRYPNNIFQIQAQIYERYHMNDVKVFYQNEDLWQIANEIYGTQERAMTPNYYILSLPGERNEEFINSIPYTPKDKRNMTGLLIARNDGDNYGKMVLLQLPKSKIIYGPMQIEAQIDQNPEISKEFSLWNSSGSTYSRGNLFIIPIEDSLLYVEPVYLEATNSSIPEVKRVIVAYGDQIAYEPTLAAALDSLFGDGTGPDPGPDPDDPDLTVEELIQKAAEAFAAAQAAAQSGNWSDYGKYMDLLQDYLDKLQQ